MSSFDDIIQEKANSHEAPVPPGAWDNIVKNKKKRRFAFFWWTLAILISGLGIAGYYHYNIYKNNDSTLSKNMMPVGSEKNNSGTLQPVEIPERKNNKEKENSSDENKVQITDENKKVQATKRTKDNITGDEKETSKNLTTNNKKNNTLSRNKEIKISIENSNTETASASKKNKSLQEKINAGSALRIKKDKEISDADLLAKNKQSKKQKGRSLIKTQAGETGIETESNTNEKKNNETTQNTERPKTVTDQITVTGETIPLKKDLAADSISKKDVAKAPVENKTQPKDKRKQSKKHPWFIDLGISPVFPIEQYDRSVSFSRSLLLNNQLSEFSGKLVNTSIDPSLAFSIALRKKISKKIMFGAGFQYLQLKENLHIAGTEKNTITNIVDKLIVGVNGPELVSDTVKTITEGTRDINATNSYRFLSIPVFIQYNFIQTRSWSLDIIGGTYITVNSLYKNEINKNAAALLTASSQTPGNKSNISFALSAGLRIGKMLSKRFQLFGIPSMTWNLGQQNIKNSMLNKKIEQAGVSFGLSYKLN